MPNLGYCKIFAWSPEVCGNGLFLSTFNIINRNFLFPLNLILIFVFTFVVTLLFVSLVCFLCFPIFPFIVLKGWGIWGRWSEEKWRGMLVVSQPVRWGANNETNSNKDKSENKRVRHLALALKSCNSNYHLFMFCSAGLEIKEAWWLCTSVATGDEILVANENNSSQTFGKK